MRMRLLTLKPGCVIMSALSAGGRAMQESILFVVTGPSGSGKGTIMRAIIKRYPDIAKIATYTTRPHAPTRSTALTTTSFHRRVS